MSPLDIYFPERNFDIENRIGRLSFYYKTEYLKTITKDVLHNGSYTNNILDYKKGREES